MMSHQVTNFRPPENGHLVTVEVEGTAVAVACVEGELYAFNDTCTHAGCSLASGTLNGSTIRCPCHLAQFDVTTGEVVAGPAERPVGIWSTTLTDETLELTPSEASDDSANAFTSVPAESERRQDSGSDHDIVELIRAEHDAMRRQFAALEDLDGPALELAWEKLVNLLDVHAAAEEQLLYPTHVQAAEEGAEETVDAVRDHNDIRDAVRRVAQQPVGSDSWWAAVRVARQVNEDHLQEEDNEVLAHFVDGTSPDARVELASRWLAFHQQHAQAHGLSGEDTDPHAVVAHGESQA